MTESKHIEIEARVYGPDMTQAERNMLRNRVTLFRKDIILLREIPIQSPHSIDVMFGAILDLTQGIGPFYKLVDLTEAQHPPAKIRKYLRQRINDLKNLKHVALFTGRNTVINMAAQFVFVTNDLPAFSVHKTKEEALFAIEQSQRNQ